MKRTLNITVNNPPNSEHHVVLGAVEQWLDQVIIDQGFCPFARVPRDDKSIHFAINDSTNEEALFKSVLFECDKLLHDDKCETSLLIYTQALKNFEDYLDFLDAANDLLVDAKLEGILQLASFHPDYLFADAPAQCPSHFTNRAPYPIIHILREDSVSEALAHFVDPEAIPQRNIEHAKQLGSSFFQKFLSRG